MKQTGLPILPDGLFPVWGGARFCLEDDDVDLRLPPWLEGLFLAPSFEVLLEVGRPGVLERSLEGRPVRGPRWDSSWSHLQESPSAQVPSFIHFLQCPR